MADNKKIVLHVGCGPVSELTFHPHFNRDEWQEVRLDIDPRVKPDIVGSMTDMRMVPSNSVDAVWSSHNIEHLLPHHVPVALREFFRVLKPAGFALILVPDLQQAAEMVAEGKLDEIAYQSPGGPIAPHDMIFGWRNETVTGNEFYCHRTGYTAKTLYWHLVRAGFAEVLVQRDGRFGLWATAYKQRPEQPRALACVEGEIYVPSQSDQQMTTYSIWQEQHRPGPEHRAQCEMRIRTWPRAPRIHLAVIAIRQDERMLAATIGSLAQQIFMPLRVTIVTPFPPAATWQDGERLRWHVARGDLLEEANRVLSDLDADWVGIADAGDQFPAHAFFSLAEAALSRSDWRMIYSDEDRINDAGAHDLPHFKPDFNLALLRSYPYMGGLLLTGHALFRQLGGFDSSLPGVEEYDLALRALEQAGEGAFGHVADVLYHRLNDGGHCNIPVSELIERGRVALSSHLGRLGVAADVGHGVFPASFRVRYAVDPQVSASVLVFADTGLGHLQRCVESVLGQTAWHGYELVVLADAAAASDVRAYVDALGGLGEPRLRVVLAAGKLAWAEARNRLASEALGEFLVFVPAVCAVMQPDWLEELLGHAVQPGVAMTAPRLLGADGKVYQTGAILGLDNQPAGTPFRGEALEYPGYYGRALLAQNFSALPGGGMVVRHGLFAGAGGFDSLFSGNLAAADLSLRLAREGGRLEWTPFASLLYSGQGGDEVDDKASWGAFYTRWLPRMARDPAYNPNLSLRHCFAVETLACLSLDPYPWKPLPRILVNPADDTGSGEYRIAAPARLLNQTLQAQVITSRATLSPVEMARVAPDVIVMQRQIYEHQVDAIRRYQRYAGAFRIFELDDLITDMPVRSALRPFMPEDVGHWLREALAICDRFIVSTPGLAEAYAHLHPDIRVVHNYLDGTRWRGLKPLRGASRKPRVGWAGGNSHSGDLDVIVEVVKALADEVEWVFFGMCTDEIRPYIHEYHAGVELDPYSAKLASLNLDLALAPLEQHPFNECKSHLKLLEYGILGYPVIATDIRPYQGDYPVVRIQNRVEDWVGAIREHLADPVERARRGDALREYVLSRWMLEDHLEVWKSAWLP